MKPILRKIITHGVVGAALLVAGPAVSASRAAELVPSVGLTRSTDSDDTKSNVGLALRGNMAGPVLQSELGVSYRSDAYYGGALKVKQIPVTASLLVFPIPTLHADAGVGWYNTKYDYDATFPPSADETKQQFGVHLGAGLQFPLAPKVGVDMTGRYVFMKDQESRIVPTTFNPDFWTMSLGLAFKL